MADSDSRRLHNDHADAAADNSDSDDMDYEPAVDDEDDDGEADGDDQDDEELLENFLDEMGGVEDDGGNESVLENSLTSDCPLIPFASHLGV